MRSTTYSRSATVTTRPRPIWSDRAGWGRMAAHSPPTHGSGPTTLPIQAETRATMGVMGTTNIEREPQSDDTPRGSAHERGYCDKAWFALRRVVLARDRHCQWRLHGGSLCDRPATEVDHIVPRRLGGPDDPANLQGLCRSHHATKTNLERQERPIRDIPRCPDCGWRWVGPDHCIKRERARRERREAREQRAHEKQRQKLQRQREREEQAVIRRQALERRCEVCGVGFIANAGNVSTDPVRHGRFCSRQCRGVAARRPQPVQCAWCRGTFLLNAKQRSKSRQRRFCSRDHLWAWQRAQAKIAGPTGQLSIWSAA